MANKIEKFLDFLESKLDLERNKIIIAIRHFNIIECLEDWKTPIAISLKLKMNVQNVYRYCNTLLKNGILQIKSINKKSIKYKNDLSENLVCKMNELTLCCVCGKRVGLNGGYLSENIERDPEVKVMCKRGCHK